MMDTLQEKLQAEMKSALKNKDKQRLGVIRLILAGIKQAEIDRQKPLDDPDITAILQKMAKQRRDAVQQYRDANRTDLADQESFELTVIQEFLPQPFTDAELEALIEEVIGRTGAQDPKAMGQVMNALRPLVQGRCDMAHVSQKVKRRLQAIP